MLEQPQSTSGRYASMISMGWYFGVQIKLGAERLGTAKAQANNIWLTVRLQLRRTITQRCNRPPFRNIASSFCAEHSGVAE